MRRLFAALLLVLAGCSGNGGTTLPEPRPEDIDARFAALSARIALARSVGSAHTLH